MQTFQFTPEAIWYRQMAFSPDGRWLALSGKPFKLVDTTGKQPPTELPLGDYRRAFAFVRGGTAIAHLPETDQLTEYNLTTRRKRNSRIQEGYARGMVADRDGETLYVSASALRYGEGSRIQVIAASNLKQRASFGKVADDMENLAISGDGQWLAAESQLHVRVWRVGGPKFPSRASVSVKPPPPVYSFALSHDGSRLATTGSSALSLWDMKTGERVAHSGKHRRTVTAVACSPAQPVLATGDNAGKVFLWDIDGRVLKKYDWGLKDVFALAFAPDGLRCAAVDRRGMVVVWDVDV